MRIRTTIIIDTIREVVINVSFINKKREDISPPISKK